jgi:predicted metalloprotease with PDZ domain
LHLRAAESATDRGGTPGKSSPDQNGRCGLGIKLAAGAEPQLQFVFSGGPAERAGLAAGDVLVAVDGLRATAEGLARLLEQRRAGESVQIHAFRRDELFATTATLAAAPQDTCWLTLDPEPAPSTRARRDGWLGQADTADATG